MEAVVVATEEELEIGKVYHHKISKVEKSEVYNQPFMVIKKVTSKEWHQSLKDYGYNFSNPDSNHRPVRYTDATAFFYEIISD